MRRFFAGRVVGLLAVVCATFVSERLSPAQTGSRPYPVGRRIEEMNRQADSTSVKSGGVSKREMNLAIESQVGLLLFKSGKTSDAYRLSTMNWCLPCHMEGRWRTISSQTLSKE